MIADSNSNIAWHRVQLKKNRDAVKALETVRFTVGEMAGSTGQTQKTHSHPEAKDRGIRAMHRCP
jgi:hypothetical protein